MMAADSASRLSLPVVFRHALAAREAADLAELWHGLQPSLAVLACHPATGTLPLHLGGVPRILPAPEPCVVLVAGASVLGNYEPIIALWEEFPTRRLRLGIVGAILAMQQGHWAIVEQCVELLWSLTPQVRIAATLVALTAAVLDLRAVALPRILDIFADPMKVHDNLCRSLVALAAAAGNLSALRLLRSRGAGSGLLNTHTSYGRLEPVFLRAGVYLQSPLANAVGNCQLQAVRVLLAHLDDGVAELYPPRE